MNDTVEKYVGPVTEWARRKLGPDGDDLAQEILLQACIALNSGRVIEDVERYIWKLARYTWCSFMRKKHKLRGQCSINDVVLATDDHADEYAETEAEHQLKARLRHEIGRLMRQERELMIAHYIDALPVAEAARQAGISESAAAWRLHVARGKVRERLMKNTETCAYRPGRLSIGISGDPGPEVCDAFQIDGNLIRENILLICSGNPSTAEEICAATGVPMCYIERDIEWLYEREFLVKTGRKYQTAFFITDKAHTEFMNGIYGKLSGAYAAALERIAAAEKDIRSLGFHGSDFKWNRLLWPMLMIFASTCIRTSEIIKVYDKRVELPMRTDGGKYQPTGSVKYDDEDIWHGYNGLVTFHSGFGDGPVNVNWLGAYNFASDFSSTVKDLGASTDTGLFDMYVSMATGEFDRARLSPYLESMLARNIAEGVVGSDLKPNFMVIDADSMEKLRGDIFQPIAAEIIEPALQSVAETAAAYVRKQLPEGIRHMADFETEMDLSALCYRIIEFAGRSGMLFLPEDGNDGATLTLVLIR